MYTLISIVDVLYGVLNNHHTCQIGYLCKLLLSTVTGPYMNTRLLAYHYLPLYVLYLELHVYCYSLDSSIGEMLNFVCFNNHYRNWYMVIVD